MHHLHRQKLLSLFDEPKTGVIYLRGAEVLYRHGTDYEYPFRQESNFLYLSGVNEPECHIVLDLKTDEYHLFIPKRDTQFAVWHGFVRSKEEYKQKYGADHIHYVNELLHVLGTLKPDKIYCINEEQAEFLEDLSREYQLDADHLNDAITYCRLIKTEWELDRLRHASAINNKAHIAAMKSLKPGMAEYEVKSVFDAVNIRHGLTQDAYNGIFAAGKNSAILHYVENCSKVKAGELFLIDAGFEYNGYASDFTRTCPANGTFDSMQSAIYQAVLDAQKEVIEMIKPGVLMENLHMHAAKVMMQGMIDAKLLKGTASGLVDNNIFALFFPHGLGHFLGLDTHDVGGYPKGVERIDRPGIKFLRARRELQPGMVITIEPGLYFIPALLKPAFEDPEKAAFLNKEKLETMLEFGGIRIEDNIIVTESGYENMTDVPKERVDIEKEMR